MKGPDFRTNRTEWRVGAAEGLELPPFRRRPPWLGGDLQTVRNVLRPPRIDLAPWAQRRVWLPVSGGDALAGALHAEGQGGTRPLVVLLHGLSGCEDSAYVRQSARFWLARGHSVLRLNLRGSAPSRPRCRGHYHAGRSEDLREALHALAQQAPRLTAAGIVAVGFSLGGNVLVKLLAESARALDIRAAVTISAPIDLAATSERFHAPRNRPYQRWLLARMKEEALAAPAALSEAERAAIRAASSVYTFDDSFIAPHFGFADAADYYRQCSAQRFLIEVEVPLLLVQAADDPWIPAESYRRFPWAEKPRLALLLPTGGGHVGFHAKDGPTPWHDRAAGVFVGKVVGCGEGYESSTEFEK